MPPPAAPTLDTAVQAMLGILSAYLPAPAGPLPAPTISVTSLTERTAGMGNYRGTEARGEFPAVELKGIRVDAVTRFQLWAQDPAQADTDVTALASQLAVDADTLWGKGFLKFTLDAVPPAEVIPSLTAWRKHADYRVLFEYAYTDAGTDSLIAQIPIDIDGEKTLVTDEMTRWDQEHAPALVVRGPFTAGTLSLLLFVPGVKPTGSVTVTRTFDGFTSRCTFPASCSAESASAIAGSTRCASTSLNALKSPARSVSTVRNPVRAGGGNPSASMRPSGGGARSVR